MMSTIKTTICCCGSPLDGSHDHSTCGPYVDEEFDIKPIPDGKGVGFVCMQPIQEFKKRRRVMWLFVEKFGKTPTIAHPCPPNLSLYNHYATEYDYYWPVVPANMFSGKSYVIDGFSPNLNKELHVGHLRNLAIANCLKKLLNHNQCNMVSLLGASLGVYSWAVEAIHQWFNFLKFHPTLYYDVLMPWDVVPRHLETNPEKKSQGCEVWDENPNVIVTTSAGKHTYNFHDIAFSKIGATGPTHYLTGAEQVEHFRALGLDDKHLPMGLVLGIDNKKMKSRKKDKDGKDVADSFTAEEAMQEIMDKFDDTPEPRQLAWNVIAWNFLHASRSANVKFDPDKWTQIESPGMYITYTYARIRAALLETPYVGNLGDPFMNVSPREMKAIKKQFKAEADDTRVWSEIICEDWHPKNPDPQYDLTPEDVELLGYSEYWKHWHIRAVQEMDPAPLANFTHDLARKLGVAYHKERIKEGRYGFQYAVYGAWHNLRRCMDYLGMFKLNKV
jgi:hypothetical protein